MREIKFRAWHKERGNMTTSITLPFLACEDSQVLRGDVAEYEFMQFTGLHDKNGVEIYEGDIIRTSVNNHYWLSVVDTASAQFGNTLFSMMFADNCTVDEDGETYTFQHRTLERKIRNSVKGDNFSEIIGNIHENPELVK